MATMEGLQIFTLDRPIGACGPLRTYERSAANGRSEPIVRDAATCLNGRFHVQLAATRGNIQARHLA